MFYFTVITGLIILVNFTLICKSEDNWWKNTVIYEVYTQSFKDSNADGFGDIKGITHQLDHFKDLGVDLIWITPFYGTPMKGFGYDITDHMKVDKLFGTMDDVDELIREVKRRGLKIIIDYVPNHTSDQHEWFQNSVKKIDPYTDYYIWRDAKGKFPNGYPIPPNNWLNVFSGWAWTWSEERQQYYYSQFAGNLPDLNLRNPLVFEELKKIIRFWLDKGVDGFRMDAAVHLVEDEQLRDEPIIGGVIKPNYNQMSHIYTQNLPETFEVIHQLREVMENEYTKKDGHTRILITEACTDPEHTKMYFDRKDYKVSHFPFNLQFMTDFDFPTSWDINGAIEKWTNKMLPDNAVSNWLTDNHDNIRVANKYSFEYVDIMNTLILILPGNAILYYGQEIGLVGPKMRRDEVFSGAIHDSQRCPMQWDDKSPNAGFSASEKPWMPLNSDYWRRNVRRQKEDFRSQYNHVKRLIELRTTETFKKGGFKTYVLSTWTYVITRYHGNDIFMGVFNLGSTSADVNLKHVIQDWPQGFRIISTSENSEYVPGEIINIRRGCCIELRPRSVMVLTPFNGKPKISNGDIIRSRKNKYDDYDNCYCAF